MIQRIFDRLDVIQRRNRILGIVFAVNTKLSQDRSSALAALFAYYALYAILPALLAATSILGILLSKNISLQHDILNSALANFPIIGNQLRSNVHSISGSTFELAGALIAAIMAVRGLAQLSIRSLGRIWYVMPSQAPNFIQTQVRSVLWGLVIGVGASLGTTLAALSSHQLILSIVGSLVISSGLFILAERLCLPSSIPVRRFYRSALASGIAWQLILFFGAQIIKHDLSHSTPLYGFFGIVLGLLAWVYLVSFMTLVFSTVDVVLTLKLWPRALDKSKPTEADIYVQELMVETQVNPSIPYPGLHQSNRER